MGVIEIVGVVVNKVMEGTVRMIIVDGLLVHRIWDGIT